MTKNLCGGRHGIHLGLGLQLTQIALYLFFYFLSMSLTSNALKLVDN